MEKQNHFYLHNDVRYKNMLEYREKTGTGRAQFRKLVKKGIIKKINVDNAKLQRDASKKNIS